MKESDRVITAIAVAVVSAVWVWQVGHIPGSQRADFDQIWFAASMLWHGRDPYPLIGPGRTFEYQWQFYYPLTAPVVVAPLGLLPLLVARMLFAAITGGLLAYLVLRDGWFRLLIFLSRSYTLHLNLLQWSVLLTCALYLPTIGFFASAKPNMGATIFAGLQTKRTAYRYAALSLIPVAISFLLQPGWVTEWVAALRTSQHFAPPILLPGGAILLLALLRWRRWEARVLLAMACIPATPGAMTLLPLLLIPKTWRATLALSVSTWAAVFLAPFLLSATTPFPELIHQLGTIAFVFTLLPTLFLVLRLPASPDHDIKSSDPLVPDAVAA